LLIARRTEGVRRVFIWIKFIWRNSKNQQNYLKKLMHKECQKNSDANLCECWFFFGFFFTNYYAFLETYLEYLKNSIWSSCEQGFYSDN